MRSTRLLTGLLAATLLAVVACAGGCAGGIAISRPAAAPAAPVTLTQEEADILTATNKARTAEGLAPLKPDAKLTAIARMRARDMAKRSYVSHVTPEGADVFGYMRMQKLQFGAAGENLAKSASDLKDTPKKALSDWLATPGQRANLLHPAYEKLGVGLAISKDGVTYVTQLFTD